MRIVILGYVVRGPLGGLAWHYLQYVLGLRRLGHDVAFIEDSGDDPWCCYDPVRGVTDGDPTFGLDWAGRLFRRVGFERWAFYDGPKGRWHGPFASAARGFCQSADIVLNISGSNAIREWTAAAPVRVFIDTDPVFTQVRNIQDEHRRGLADEHNRHFTFGENFGAGATIPDDGYDWQPTRQPVVLDVWDGAPEASSCRRYTTLMQWDSYASVDHEGHHYGMKSESFAGIEQLPGMVEVELETAVGNPHAPRARLRELGWTVRDPPAVASDAWSHRDYVHGSRGEFSVAKHGYVASNSGWFSERTANYLASGRPVIVQDTGFGAQLPVGRGLLTFQTIEDAVESLRMVESDVAAHGLAARAIAAEHFRSDAVLTSLLDRVG